MAGRIERPFEDEEGLVRALAGMALVVAMLHWADMAPPPAPSWAIAVDCTMT